MFQTRCVVFGYALALGLWAGVETAAGPLGTAFTYQGQLKQGGAPIDGTAHLRFSLWDAAGNGSPPVGGSQIGASQLLANVPVSNGLFTVTLNGSDPFGANAFNGEARWLQIEVCADVGCGTLSILSPRQPLTPAPYALALPGLRTQQNAVSPNLIGGLHENSVTPNVVGATISGGGVTGPDINRVTDNFGTVAGGCTNRAGDNAGSVSDRAWATVGGGLSNTAGGGYSTVGGGEFNNATSEYGTVGGGQSNNATARGSTVGGGEANNATGIASTVGGGLANNATLTASTVGGGINNSATGHWSIVPGGIQNTAGGEYSFAAGRRAKVRTAAQSGDPDGDQGTFVWADSTDADFQSTGPNQFLIRASGGVGIGTNAPAAPLHIASAQGLRIGGADEGGLVVGYSGGPGGGEIGLSTNRTQDGTFINPNRPGWYLGVRAKNDDFVIFRQGSPQTGAVQLLKLDSGGNLCLGGTLTCASSRRWKQHIEPLHNALDKVMRLQGVSYRWDETHGGAPDIGFIAEEVGRIVPDAVTWESDGQSALGIKTDRISALTVEAIKELDAKVKAKDAEIAELRAHLEQFEAMLERVKSKGERERP